MNNDLPRALQAARKPIPPARLKRVRQINLQLASLMQPGWIGDPDDMLDTADDLLRNYRQHRRLLQGYRCPADQRIQNFINAYLARNGVDAKVQLPSDPFVLDRAGLAAELSLPAEGDLFQSQWLTSYRVRQGVLHNPSKDRRTTVGVFHIVEGGLPIPWDKKAVPAVTFAALFNAAMNPPEALLNLPFTAEQEPGAKLWISLLLRPLVSPEVAGVMPEKRMETRFFAPGGLVSNLDFVERIFGNAGDPYLPQNDAGLDVTHWSGHTGCVILAPHLTGLLKKDVGLPHWNDASERQRRDGMCWQNEDEFYNDGGAFKIVCRDMDGVIVTLIADNYFGYSKKEIKSQISYAANLFGGSEEEHSGGALAFPSFNLGDSYSLDSRYLADGHTMLDMMRLYADDIDFRPEGHGIDKRYPQIIYVPEDTHMDLLEQQANWTWSNELRQLKLLAGHTYIYPCGFKVHLEKHPHAPSWRLVGSEAEGAFCYKPCTVSGGGKSEISKSLVSALLSGPFYVQDLKHDLDQVEALLRHSFCDRFKTPPASGMDTRGLFALNRTLGSVIRLLTPSEEYTDNYNTWLESIPPHIRALAIVIKRFYRPEWGNDWREHFNVDLVDGRPAHELKYHRRRLEASFLRVGRLDDGAWRVCKVRQDFVGAQKVQLADDIAVSATIPTRLLRDTQTGIASETACKIVANCETRLFQRPDDAKYRGLDPHTELDLTLDDNFISNFQPLTRADARELVDDVLTFHHYSLPMQRFIEAAASEDGYFVSSAHPRLVNGKPSPNVRYLQARPDLVNPIERHIADMGTRLYRRMRISDPVHLPVNTMLPGRRNNPPKPGIRPLAVYGPIHYQELPELFMDFIASLSGKSPSTTGAGSEGALTKGPFNALCATADLNNALVSFILCGHDGYTTAAGHIGPNRRVDHDISFLMPEIWCRLTPEQRDASWMIKKGYLEKLEDFEFDSQPVLASRLGYRISNRFMHAFLGKIFDDPMQVFDEAMLRPETQNLAAFVDGVNHIVEAHQKVAQGYLDDGSIDDACPPLKALLYIMAEGKFDGKDLAHPEIRKLFSKANLLASDWYKQRLSIKQQRDITLYQRHVDYLTQFLAETNTRCEPDGIAHCEAQLAEARAKLVEVSAPAYLESLWGSLGADWVHRQAVASASRA
jgi:phosphoenolpyruvate carboxykinase (diphosphate)